MPTLLLLDTSLSMERLAGPSAAGQDDSATTNGTGGGDLDRGDTLLALAHNGLLKLVDHLEVQRFHEIQTCRLHITTTYMYRELEL